MHRSFFRIAVLLLLIIFFSPALKHTSGQTFHCDKANNNLYFESFCAKLSGTDCDQHNPPDICEYHSL